MNNRIKELRIALNLTQEELASAIGLSKSGISALEYGTRKVNDKHIRMLNMTYNVNPEWLRTGKGNMFLPVDNSPLAAIQKQYNLSDKTSTIIQNFLNLPKSDQETFIDVAEKIFNSND